MTKLAMIIFLSACPLSAQDCSDPTDACRAGPKTLSPFVAASIGESLPQPASPGARKEAVREALPEKKKKPAAVIEKSPEKATSDGEVLPSEPRPVPEAAATAQSGKFGVTNPIWLVFIGALLVGIYFYLSGDGRGEKKK